MKAFILLSIFTIPSAFATNFLLESTCTGKYASGEELKLTLHVDEAMYCDNEPKESYPSVIVLESKENGPGQDVFLAKNLPLADQTGDGYVVANVDYEGKEIQALILEHNQSKEASLKFISDMNEDGSVVYEEIKLKCASIHYTMRCDK